MDPVPYPRDMVGYGPMPPQPLWPGKARLALNFVVNYEEGGENCVLHGDPASEAYLTEIVGTAPLPGQRNPTIESLYEFGSRVGVWRLLSLFAAHGLPFTAFAVGMALERNPEVARRMAAEGHEIASHGWRWIDYRDIDEATERDHMQRAIRLIRDLTGQRPLGWYTGRISAQTARLVAEEGGFLYHSDSYADELPYWERIGAAGNLVVPYTLDVNDMKFGGYQGFNSGDQFFTYLKDSFDWLYREGATTPRMMSVGLHCRIAGRPGRIAALDRFLTHVRRHPDVWVCRRDEIARHWRATHPLSPIQAAT
ncbi:allantoinase PuuE [Rhodobacter sp. SGA-6-6]|uniref:allantoinase PuuE n=1 Tax=Rhodobacter sp. SGA-6-6 TaxID=2710882 RepID=UPI0013EAAE13|nr:allantoinase PuuE [Rhodobacter sp. SGA-6-6]NGM47479.1 allantoinase PuuE [Rhodobacter sp. SGA-6-6]